MRKLLLVFNLSFLLTNPAQAQLPSYDVDIESAVGASPLTPGTAADGDAYNADSANLQAHPTFAQEAILNFGTRQVRVYLIASRHDSKADREFIFAQLDRFGVPPASTHLFIEQSDRLTNSGASELRRLILASAADLEPALRKAELNPRSELNLHYLDTSPFAQVEETWKARQGQVIHIDLSLDFSEKASHFFSQQVGIEKAFEFLRLALDSESFTFAEFQELVTRIYPVDFSPAKVAGELDCCGTPRGWTATFLSDNQLRDLARERYMRWILYQKLDDGDVIVTHPVHMKHLLEHERLPQT